MDPARELVRAYHERTKHRIGRYARSLGFLDWDTQPDPFRRFDGAPRVALIEVPPSQRPTFDDITHEHRTPPSPLSAATLAQLLYDSVAISAWKAIETSRWSLRCNPSSGNLHPTEIYLMLPACDGIAEQPGVHHYSPFDHALELRRPLPHERFARLFPNLAPGSFLVALTSIHWRESWKYGERAFRYCQHDVGHAIAAIAYAASTLGWCVRARFEVTDDDLDGLLGLDCDKQIESEHPDLVLEVVTDGNPQRPDSQSFLIDPTALAETAGRACLGTPNVLSSDHVEWSVIDQVAEATRRSPAEPARDLVPRTFRAIPNPLDEIPERGRSARTLFRQRRSAVAFDGKTGITRDAFVRLLERLMPRAGRVPFATFEDTPRIHPVLFVHRVADLSPGLYVLPRTEQVESRMRATFDSRFEFAAVEGCPESLPLRRLDRGDVRNGAALVACDQAIAADGAFAVGMLAEFDAALDELGAFAYRRLHWEAGMLGQTLYLEAEAVGIRGTGIGCFFDDSMHQLLGLKNTQFQTLYHFTVGGPVEDTRLQTLPAYEPDRLLGR